MLNNIHDLLLVGKKQEETEPYYEVLQYISGDGSQFFETDYYATDNSEYQFRAMCYNDVTGARQVFGVLTTDNTASVNAYLNYIDSSTRNARWGDKTLVNSTATASAWHDCSLSKNGYTADGVNVAFSSATFTGTSARPVAILAINPVSGLPSSGGQIRLACFRIFESGVLVRDYVPVLDKQMRPCLYDRLSKTFLYAKKISDGTTTYDLTFERWDKYTVDYLQGDGDSYVPLNITPTATMGMEIEYAYTVLSSEEPAGVIGTYNGDTQRKDTFFVSTSSGYTQKASSPSSASCGVMVFHRGGNIGTSSSTSASYIEPEADKWYSATVNWLGDGNIVWTDGENELTNACGENPISTNALRAFSRCNSSNGTYNNSKSKIRKLTFSDGSNVIHNFIPSVRSYKSGSSVLTKAFFYDEVYNKAYYNGGTGVLSAFIDDEKEVYDLAMTESMDIYVLNPNTNPQAYGGYIGGTDGKVVADATSCYTKAIPVQKGDILTLTVTGRTFGTSPYNKRIHAYTADDGTIAVGQKGSWVSQLDYINFPAKQTDWETKTISVTVPSGVNYIRISHCIGSSSNIIESKCTLTRYRNLTVGAYVSGSPSSVTGTSNCFDTGLYGTQNTHVNLITMALDNPTAAGQLFGSYDGSEATSKNLTINSIGSGNTAPLRFDGQAITTAIKVANTMASIAENKYGIWVNNALHGTWGDVADFTTKTTLLVLKCNNSSNVRSSGCMYLSIYEDGVLVAEYIPVRNSADSTKFGLYDTVSQELNMGVGTLSFVAIS